MLPALVVINVSSRLTAGFRGNTADPSSLLNWGVGAATPDALVLVDKISLNLAPGTFPSRKLLPLIILKLLSGRLASVLPSEASLMPGRMTSKQPILFIQSSPIFLVGSQSAGFSPSNFFKFDLSRQSSAAFSRQ